MFLNKDKKSNYIFVFFYIFYFLCFLYILFFGFLIFSYFFKLLYPGLLRASSRSCEAFLSRACCCCGESIRLLGEGRERGCAVLLGHFSGEDCVSW